MPKTRTNVNLNPGTGPSNAVFPGGIGTTKHRGRTRQRMSAIRHTAASGTAVDTILHQWHQAGLVDTAEFAQARKYVGLTLLTIGAQ